MSKEDMDLKEAAGDSANRISSTDRVKKDKNTGEGLSVQDLSKLNQSKLTPLTPED